MDPAYVLAVLSCWHVVRSLVLVILRVHPYALEGEGHVAHLAFHDNFLSGHQVDKMIPFHFLLGQGEIP